MLLHSSLENRNVCTGCEGAGSLMGLGFVKEKCPICTGTGFLEKSHYNSETAPVPAVVLERKKSGRKPRIEKHGEA